MPAIKVGVREFREQMARYLESDSPVAVTRRGETIGVFVPTPRHQPAPANVDELRAAADRLAEMLKDVDEDEFAAEFERLRRTASPAKRRPGSERGKLEASQTPQAMA